MSKKDDDPIRATLEFPKKEHGLALSVGSWPGFLLGSAALLAGGIWLWGRLHKYSRPKPYRAQSEPWAGWHILLWIVLILVIIVAVGFLVYLAIRLSIHLRHKSAEATEAQVRARTIPAENGALPMMLSRDLKHAVNLNAAPAGRVDDLDGRPVMPDPATRAQAEGAYRATFVQIAASAGARGTAAMLDMLGRRPEQPAGMPPLVAWDQGAGVDELPTNVQEFVELAAQEYRLLAAGESVEDDE